MIRPTVSGAGITLNGGTLASGDVQPTPSPTASTSTRLTIDNRVSNGNLDASGGNSTFLFALGSGTIDNTTKFDFGSPNTDSTYLTFLSNNPGTPGASQIKFASSDTITVNDLSDDNLQLSINTPYLLMQAETAPGEHSVMDNDFYLGLTTTGGTDADGDIMNGYVIMSLTLNGTAVAETYAAQLYLYNGELEIVPEPGTWALILGGFGLLVILQRARRRD